MPGSHKRKRKMDGKGGREGKAKEGRIEEKAKLYSCFITL